MKLASLILLLVSFCQISFAQTEALVERNFTGVSKETLPQNARKDILDQAYQQVSEDLIKDLVGEDRFSKNKSVINSKVIKNAARYIPFSKPGDLTPDNQGFKMSVAIKVSLKDLKTLLQENGLLNESDSTPVVMPVLNFVDRVSLKSFRWWQASESEQKPFLQAQGRYFENSLRSSFQRSGFYLIRPQENDAAMDVPLSFQNEKLNTEDAQFFGQYFNASVLVDGQILISKSSQINNAYRIEVRMTATQISNSRPIADVSRKVDTEPGSFEAVVDKRMREIAEASANDLATQVYEAWQRGSLGTSMVRLTLQGNFDLGFLESFKDRLRNQVPQVRNIRERLFSAGRYSYEVDTSASAQELIQKMQGMDFGGKKANKVSEVDNEIVLQFN